MDNSIIPIFFTIDDKYAPYLSCAIKSMIDHASKDRKYKIIIIHENIKQENIEKLAELKTENFEMQFVPMKDGLESITNREENFLKCDYFTLTIYFRLFIPDMFPEYDKGIYIDSDIIVPGDISKLYDIELGENLIGACPDFSIKGIPELENYLENYIGVNKEDYVNSGVLLMNLKALRERKFSESFLELLNKYHFYTVAPDQDYINAMCNGKIHYLDEVWDAMPKPGTPEMRNPNLVHYNLFYKPWHYDNIPYEKYFWDYAKESKFYDAILKEKNGYSDEAKQQDEETLAFLISKGDTLPASDVSFKKVYEAGEKVRV